MFILLLLAACQQPPPPPAPPPPLPEVSAPPPVWPLDAAVLVAPEVPESTKAVKVFLDPGHGTGTNTGNRGVLCQSEEVFAQDLAVDLAAQLEALGPFEVRSARPDGARTGYKRRVAAAKAWGADVFISIHSDARGEAAYYWEPFPSWSCIRWDKSPGFAVLVSDQGGTALSNRRRKFARSLAAELDGAGFPAYDGHDYGTLYDLDTEPGVFIDRRGLLMLRRPEMVSVIVETHNAFDLEEARRWEEPRVRSVFARAVAAGVLKYSGADGPTDNRDGVAKADVEEGAE